jgi:hypothetical protein
VASKPTPTMVNFIMCEKIIKCQLSGKESLIDLFQNIQSPQFPFKFPCWYYCTLEGGHGDYQMDFLLRNVETGKSAVLWTGTFRLDPTRRAAFINNIMPTFEAPGLYEIAAVCKDGRESIVIGTRQFTVSQMAISSPTV